MTIPEFNTRAELVLNLFDVSLDKVSIEKKGRFYKGYCYDIVESDASTISLARNGLMHFLPEGLFYDEEYLRQHSPEEDQKKRLENLSQIKKLYAIFFKSLDNIFFRQEFALEKKISELEVDRDAILLNEIYGFDLHRERDPFVARLAVLRLHAPQVKGNVFILSHFVSAIIGERVYMETVKTVADTQQISEVVSSVRFIIEIPSLSAEAYNKKMEQLELFFSLLSQWFLPFDLDCDYCIKDRRQRMILGEQLVLDYNTQLL